VLLVGEVRQQRVRQQVDDFLQAVVVAGMRDELHQRPVDLVEHVVNDPMFLLQGRLSTGARGSSLLRRWRSQISFRSSPHRP
jgi:hypothetical protein